MATLQQMSAEALSRDAARPAIEFEGHWHNWGEIKQVANAVRELLAASGIAAGAPVAFIPRNRPNAFAALLGLIADGRTISMIYAFQSAAGMAWDVIRLKPAAIVLDAQDAVPEFCDILAEQGIAAIALDGMTAYAVSGIGTASWTAAARSGPSEPQIEILTSGTTGPPKQFAISYALLERFFIDSALTRQQGDNPEALPPFLLFFPLGNISGLYSSLPMLLRGQRIVLLERFTVPGWHDYVKRFRPAHSGLPPSCVQQVLDACIPKEDLSSIKMLGIGAAPLDPTVQMAFEDHYGIPILISYGATEFAGPVAAMTVDLHAEWGRKKLGTVGRAMPGAQLRIVDADTGEPLPPGQEGLLEVISPRIGLEWIRTSDIAMIDEDGFLFHRGRADGAIMRGGFKILPESVERALMLHPAVSEAAVTGIADHRLGQVPAAAIRLKPDAPEPSIEELKGHLRQHVLATHIPTKWLFCKELPRTPSLKADRAAVRRLFEQEAPATNF
jgi:long-chain acyl-CoA synthetase